MLPLTPKFNFLQPILALNNEIEINEGHDARHEIHLRDQQYDLSYVRERYVTRSEAEEIVFVN